jgi:hypothetical protein
MRRYLPYLGLVVFLLAMGNFAWVFAEYSYWGGSAVGGYQSGGHYYLSTKPPSDKEVSQAVWEWLRFHQYSLFVTHPLGLAGAWWHWHADANRRSAGWATPERAAARVRSVRGSGPELSTSKVWGQAPGSGNGPGSTLWLHPAGIVFKSRFMAPHSIAYSEMESVRPCRWFLSKGIEIEHKGIDTSSPYRFYPRDRDGLLAAINEGLRTAATEGAPRTEPIPHTQPPGHPSGGPPLSGE